MGFYRTNADKERINSFAEAEARYNDVKPVISKNHTKGDDIRPVGDRRRKWERIVKVSDTCYELTVTDYFHDNVPLIRWESIDGYYEQITFWNNGRVSGYTMLENLCPVDLVFFVDGSTGRQYVGIAGGDRCFAPKDMQKPITFKRLRSDNVERIELQHPIVWEQVGTKYVFKHAMTRVNKQIKEAVKPLTDKFYKWVITTYPMLPLSDYQYRYKMQKEFEEYFNGKGINYTWYNRGNPDAVEDKINMLRDEEHEMRLHLAMEWLVDSNLYDYHGNRTVTSQEDATKVRASWNRFVNRTLGLNFNVEEEKIEEEKIND